MRAFIVIVAVVAVLFAFCGTSDAGGYGVQGFVAPQQIAVGGCVNGYCAPQAIVGGYGAQAFVAPQAVVGGYGVGIAAPFVQRQVFIRQPFGLGFGLGFRRPFIGFGGPRAIVVGRGLGVNRVVRVRR